MYCQNKAIPGKHKSNRQPHPFHVTRHLIQPPEISRPLHGMTTVTTGFLNQHLSAYHNKTHFPITHLIYTVECRVVAVYSLSFSFRSQFGAAGNNAAHLLLFTKSFPPTVLCQNNQMKYVYPLSYMFLIYTMPTGRERRRGVKSAMSLLCSEADQGFLPKQ